MIAYIAIISFFLTIVSAQEPTASEVLEKVRSHYSSLNDASAEFTQTVIMRFKKTGRQVTGSIKIKKGNKYRLETEQQTVVTDGKTVWMYNPNTKQVLKDSFKQNRQTFSPDKFLFGLPKEFSALTLEKDSQYYVIRLQPSNTGAPSSTITALKIWARPETWIVEKIELIDRNNTMTTFFLSKIKFNHGIPDQDFQFIISNEMKVVDLKTIQQPQ